MIPRAKTDRRRNAPPEKRSRKPKAPPAVLKNSANATGSTPGVGMCDPRRYTASSANVNITRLRRSSIAQMLRSVSRKFKLLNLLAGAACRFDLFAGRLGEPGGLNGQLLGKLAVAQDLDAVVLSLDQAGLAKRRLVDGGPVIEALEVGEIHDRVYFLEDIGETALRQ